MYSRPPGINNMSRPEFGERHYEIVAEIGRGAYGTVYKARDIKNEGEFVALKEIRIQTSSEEGMPMSTMREIAMLKQLENLLDHQNIVRLLDVCHGSRNHREMRLMLVFEHVEQDLARYLEKVPPPGLGPDRIKDLMHQLMHGVDFLHSNRIVHRDLKPQNILVTNTGQIKIADFGLARIYGFEMALTTVVVTLYYRSPEVLLQDAYCTAVDVWSCGCIFVELHTRSIIGLPTEREWPQNASLPWESFLLSPKLAWEKVVPEIRPLAKDLVDRMLVFNQHVRIDALDALQHPFFTTDNANCYSSADRNLSQDLDESMDSRNTSSSSGVDLSDDHIDNCGLSAPLEVSNLEADEKLDESEESDPSSNSPTTSGSSSGVVSCSPPVSDRGEKRKRAEEEHFTDHAFTKITAVRN